MDANWYWEDLKRAKQKFENGQNVQPEMVIIV